MDRARSEPPGPARSAAEAALDGAEEWDIGRFSIVGNYVRLDEGDRNHLNDLRQRIVSAFARHEPVPSNFLVWGSPGSGKSYLVQQIAAVLPKEVRFVELNLGQLDEAGFRSSLERSLAGDDPVLCFIDEVDSHPDRAWPYELLLPRLEPPQPRSSPTCFVLAGSGGDSLESLRARMEQRPKGRDLLSRIPRGHEFRVRRLGPGDKMVVATTQLVLAAASEGHRVRDVEKLALYYIASQPVFDSARQLRALASQTAQRIPAGEDRIRYDYLFRAGDPENKSFWSSEGQAHPGYLDHFVRIRGLELPAPGPPGRPQELPSPLPATERRGTLPRVAVLPLANISPDPSDEYFADGMTEELISSLSRIPGLDVISRTSVQSYKTRVARMADIARELGVQTVVEGTVRKVGKRVRISAQLVDAKNDRHVWSSSFDRDLEDVLSIQAEIARHVAAAVEQQLRPSTGAASSRAAPSNSEAYTSYLKGRYYWSRLSKEWLERATEQFELSIRLDPAFAPAYAGMANIFLLRGRRGDVPPQDSYPRAAELAKKALSLDPNLSEPHYVLGSILQEYDWRWEESDREFREAITRNPNDSVSHLYYGLYLGHVGRVKEGIVEAERARDLDPLAPRVHTGSSEEYQFARMYREAIESAQRALALDPAYGAAHAYIGQALVEMGRTEAAVASFREADRMLGGQAVKGRLGHALAKAGQADEARAILKELESGAVAASGWNPFLSERSYLSLDIGLVYLGLGDVRSALTWFERAREAKVPEVVHYKCEPIYDPVQREPRFRAILDSIGLS